VLKPDADHAPQNFTRFGHASLQSPIVYAIPHAGRLYSAALLNAARVDQRVLMRLEDRHMDQLADRLITAGATALVARAPRALIDLNRDEREFDASMVSGLPREARPLETAKVRGGLGLVPVRLAYAGHLWRVPVPYAELQRRIMDIHRPYHQAIADALEAARQRFGTALLVDLHSMPPLARGADGAAPANIVIGDRFGRSAASRFSGICADAAVHGGFAPAINVPYPGSYTLDRHGAPDRDIHAIQIEIDRSLYLDERLEMPGDGFAATQRLLGLIDHHLRQELLGGAALQAAE
jgi:N-formylglutamate amidohydrolase